MHDGVDAVHRRIQPVAGAHVPDDVLDVGPMPPPSAAQNANILAGGRQAVDDDATHSPGAAGYQYSIRHGLNLGGPRAPRYRTRYRI